MPDRILIEGLAVETVIGLYDWERRVRQSLRVDIELHCDLSAAGATDRVDDTVDYKALSIAVRERAESSRYQLIETLAGDIAETCLLWEQVAWAAVRVHKPGALRHADNVAVAIERARGDVLGRPQHVAFVGVGSNIDPVPHIRAALTAMHDEFGALRVSPAYRTAAVGSPGAPDFINLAVELRTDRTPADLSAWLHGVEDRNGRERGDDRNAPRTLDLDLLLYDDRIVDDGGLTVPDPLIETAAFVLVPLAHIAAPVRHPGLDVTIGELRARLPQTIEGIEPFEEKVLF